MHVHMHVGVRDAKAYLAWAASAGGGEDGDGPDGLLTAATTVTMGATAAVAVAAAGACGSTRGARRSVCARDACEGKCALRVCGGCAWRVRRGRGREFERCTCAPSKVDEVDDSKQRQEEHRSEERCPAHPRVSHS